MAMREKAINVMALEYETCVCCGEIIPEGRQVCHSCENNGDADFQRKKRAALQSLYGYDVSDWEGIKVSPGYNEKDGREALRDLLWEIHERGEDSQK